MDNNYDYNVDSDKIQIPHMSVADWLITLFILILPFVNIISLIVWAISARNPSKKTFAIAYLILTVIGIFVGIILFSALSTLGITE